MPVMTEDNLQVVLRAIARLIVDTADRHRETTGRGTRLDPYEAVRTFHERFDLSRADRPTLQSASTHTLRAELIREESREVIEALDGQDLAHVARELADLLYVTYGTAVSLGIDIRPVFEAVHKANMAKVGGSVREDGKVVKPAGWQPPDVQAIIEVQQLER